MWNELLIETVSEEYETLSYLIGFVSLQLCMHSFCYKKFQFAFDNKSAEKVYSIFTAADDFYHSPHL